MSENVKTGTGSLGQKFLIPLLVVSFLGVAVGELVIHRSISERMEDQAMQRAEQLLNAINYAMETLDQTTDRQRLVSAMGAERDVSMIVVVGGAPATVIASTRNEWLEKKLTELTVVNVREDIEETISTGESHHHYHDDTDDYVFSNILFLTDSSEPDASLVQGALMIHIDAALIREQVSEATREVSVLILGWMIVVSLLAYFLVHRLVLRPARAISGAISRRADGDANAYAPVASHDELGRLAMTLNEMFDALSAKNAELRQYQKLESIGTLASGVAHEINNPIMGIMNYARIILDDLDPDSPLREFAEGIGEETDRVATIVRNLLQFSRQDKESHSPAHISDIVKNTLNLLQTIIGKDQIQLTVDVPDDLPQLKCRSQQIQQVLMNLLTNGRDSLNQRYPSYDADKTLSVTVRQFEKEGRRWLRVTVEDHGSGVPDEIKGRILDPFFTTKDRASGTGLGLAISYGLVKDHHGELSVETELDKYTRFHLDLPVDNGWTLSEESGKSEATV